MDLSAMVSNDESMVRSEQDRRYSRKSEKTGARRTKINNFLNYSPLKSSSLAKISTEYISSTKIGAPNSD